GDMVDHHPDYVYRFADCLEDMRPRLGRYAVIGNHDVYTGRRAVATRMEERDFVMLRKEWVSLEDKGSSLVLAGLDDSGMNWTSDDPSTRKISETVEGVPPDRPSILLKHRPLSFSDIKGLPVDLVIAGHTHGGQLKLPFGGPGLAHLTYRYPEGFHKKDEQMIYTSRGLGTVGWPFRVFCPPEITLLVLRSPDKKDEVNSEY
ncbi:MAG: metallophosphoesterase, partial [bacterium]